MDLPATMAGLESGGTASLGVWGLDMAQTLTVPASGLSADDLTLRVGMPRLFSLPELRFRWFD
jgi:hypothetical protein